MGKIMVFDKRISGHNMEYLHHLYTGALRDASKEYVFVVPQSFVEQKGKFKWEENKNIEFHYLNKNESVEGVGLQKVFQDIRLLRRLIKLYNIERIILINWLLTIIFYFLPLRTHVSGIMYYIYLYEWSEMNWKEKARRVIAALQMVYCPQISDIYVLNDETAATYLNKKYKTVKFKYLPDPLNIPPASPIDQRVKLGIGMGKKIFLHFGAMTNRKGTIEIMESITLLTPEERKNYHFIFAGIIDNSIKTEFYRYYNGIKEEGVITLFECFCPYEQIADLCYTCDVILMPYKLVSNSSGVVAYASYFQKPVIGPSKGLIGKIIRKYQLGSRLDEISGRNLALLYPIKQKIGDRSRQYMEINSIQAFNQQILGV